MKRGSWLGALCAVLATAAGAQPMLIDPEGELRLNLATVVSGLSDPRAIAFLDADEFLVLERQTGRVRRVVVTDGVGVIQANDAIDLDVDTCGERGLIGIALHPSFGAATDPVNDVFLSYHPPAADCSGAPTTLRVSRFQWNGTELVNEAPLPTAFDKPVDASTLVGGSLLFGPIGLEVFGIEPSLHVVMGSLGHNGALQNATTRVLTPNPPLDDTSVIFRLKEDGEPAVGNPFDLDDDDLPEDSYFVYGLRDSADITTDPLTGSLWFTEKSADQFDEINISAPFGMNSGFNKIRGPLSRNPGADPITGLFHFAKSGDQFVSTYVDPRFSFQEKIDPTGIAFAGQEQGRISFDLFVGDASGDLYRFELDPFRSSFILRAPLEDGVADAAVEDDPETEEEDESRPADDQSQILIGMGFGAISDLESAPDQSVYVVGSAAGAVYRVFFDPLRDFAITSVKAPKKVTLGSTKAIKVQLVNRGELTEIFETIPELAGIFDLELLSQGPTCMGMEPSATLATPKTLNIEPGKKLSLAFDVSWDCANDPSQGTPDFAVRLTVDLPGDKVPANDVCPRGPGADDKGCGAKDANGDLGGEILVDVVQK